MLRSRKIDSGVRNCPLNARNGTRPWSRAIAFPLFPPGEDEYDRMPARRNFEGNRPKMAFCFSGVFLPERRPRGRVNSGCLVSGLSVSRSGYFVTKAPNRPPLGIKGLGEGPFKPLKIRVFLHLSEVVRVKGIEPSPQAWEARILPLNYTRHSTGKDGYLVSHAIKA